MTVSTLHTKTTLSKSAKKKKKKKKKYFVRSYRIFNPCFNFGQPVSGDSF